MSPCRLRRLPVHTRSLARSASEESRSTSATPRRLRRPHQLSVSNQPIRSGVVLKRTVTIGHPHTLAPPTFGSQPIRSVGYQPGSIKATRSAAGIQCLARSLRGCSRLASPHRKQSTARRRRRRATTRTEKEAYTRWLARSRRRIPKQFGYASPLAQTTSTRSVSRPVAQERRAKMPAHSISLARSEESRSNLATPHRLRRLPAHTREHNSDAPGCYCTRTRRPHQGRRTSRQAKPHWLCQENSQQQEEEGPPRGPRRRPTPSASGESLAMHLKALACTRLRGLPVLLRATHSFIKDIFPTS